MNIINKSTMAAVMASMSMPMMAATNTPDVKGTIVDEMGEPMSFVNVVLLSLPDSTFVQGATSDTEGIFNIETPAVEGLLKISSIGYETQYIDTRSFTQGGIRIQMKENNQMLGEVTVKAQLPKTKLTGNAMITSIQGSVLEKSGSAKDMLAKVPGMTLKDDELEVLGKGTPVFYINGRKVTDKDEFKRLRSEEIQDVEVITNPGAMYDATVSAVVKIRTIRREGSGFGYDLSTSNNQDLQHGYSDPNGTLNLRYRHNTLDFFGMINYWKWDSYNGSKIDQKTYIMSEGKLKELSQLADFNNTWQGQGINSNLGFNWQISDNHSIGMRVERHDHFHTGNIVNERTVITPSYTDGKSKTIESAIYTETHQRSKARQPYNWEGDGYYSGRVGKMGIDFNVDFMASKTIETNTIEDANNTDLSMQSYNPESSSMIADKLVLSYPIWNGQLEIGSEMTFVHRNTSYRTVGLNFPSSQSKVQENNVAAFFQYGCQIPVIGNVSIGARYEHVGFNYTDCLNDDKSMTRYTDDIFPSASWSQQFGDWQAAVSYSYKTNRPSYWQLSEAISYFNAYSLQQGDSKLKNEKVQDISANARWKWITLYAAYERRDNFLTQWSYIYDNTQQAPANTSIKDFGEGTILIKNINLDVPVRSLATYISASPTFGCFSPNWTIGIQQFDAKMQLADPREATGKRNVHYYRPIGILNCNNTFRLKHSWQLEANFNATTAGDFCNFQLFSPSNSLAFVVQKCWLKNDALCLRASISDVYRNASNNIRMDCGYYTLKQAQFNNKQRLDVSLRYIFNATQSKYKGTGAGREAAGRMSK